MGILIEEPSNIPSTNGWDILISKLSIQTAALNLCDFSIVSGTCTIKRGSRYAINHSFYKEVQDTAIPIVGSGIAMWVYAIASGNSESLLEINATRPVKDAEKGGWYAPATNNRAIAVLSNISSSNTPYFNSYRLLMFDDSSPIPSDGLTGLPDSAYGSLYFSVEPTNPTRKGSILLPLGWYRIILAGGSCGLNGSPGQGWLDWGNISPGYRSGAAYPGESGTTGTDGEVISIISYIPHDTYIKYNIGRAGGNGGNGETKTRKPDADSPIIPVPSIYGGGGAGAGAAGEDSYTTYPIALNCKGGIAGISGKGGDAHWDYENGSPNSYLAINHNIEISPIGGGNGGVIAGFWQGAFRDRPYYMISAVGGTNSTDKVVNSRAGYLRIFNLVS